jgi:N-acetylneuraminate synthase
MTIDSRMDHFLIKDGLWEGYSLYDLYEEAHTPFDWHEELFNYASQLGITLFSSPFDESAIDLLEDLDTPAFKIASFELVDIPLIKYAAKLNKPMLMSTGMATINEISEAVEAVKAQGNNQIMLFHCVSSYPAELSESNLRNIEILKKEFALEIGLSDHTMTNTASISALTLGAVAFEKHFKVDANEDGPDSSFSLLPEQLETIIRECNDTWSALSSRSFERSKSEDSNKIFRRSLCFVEDKAEGDIVLETDIRRIRPGYGLPPKFYDDVIGMKVTKDLLRGTPVTWDLLKKNDT